MSEHQAPARQRPDVVSALFFCVAFVLLASMAIAQESQKTPAVKQDGGQADAPIVTFRGHTTEVAALAFSADGSQVVSVSAKDVCVWDPATGKEIRRLPVEGDNVVAVSRDLRRLAIARSFHATVAGALRGKLTLQDAATGKDVLSIDPHGNWDKAFPFRPSIAALAFSPDGKRLATAGSVTKVGGGHGLPGGVVKIWDAETGKELQQFGSLSTRADAVVFSADGKYLAAGTQGASGELPEPGEVHVWDTTTGQRLHTFKTQPEIEQGGDPSSVANLAFHPKGTRLAAAVSDGTVRLWELPSGREMLTLRGHQGQAGGQEVDKFTGRIMGPGRAVRSVAFNPDGSRLASAGYDRVVRILDTETGKETKTYRFDSARINAVAFSPDGRRLAAGGSNGAKSGEAVVWQLSDKPEKVGGPVLPALPKGTAANIELDVTRQIENALKTEDKPWQDLDAPRRGIKDRVVKILSRTSALSDQQVASAVYLLAVGRSPTDEELEQAQKDFAQTNGRPLSVLQRTRGLVQGKEFSAGVAATNGRLFKTQQDLAAEPGTGKIARGLNADEFQKLIGECAAAVNQAVKTDEQFVDLAFLLALSRFPTATESNPLVAHLKKASDRGMATRDIFVFLLNTKEFLLAK